jgi:hypothetical protein
MECTLLSAAEKFGIPASVLDVIGRQFITQVVEEYPCLLLPPIMETLKRSDDVVHGVDTWDARVPEREAEAEPVTTPALTPKPAFDWMI